MQVGFVGLGDQGAPIAAALARSYGPLQVWARNSASLGALAGLAVQPHATPAGLGRCCDVVGVCVADDDALREVLVGGGLLQALRPGSVLLNHGTGAPAVARELAALGARQGVDVLDAPVSGGRAKAAAGSLVVMIGGPAEAVDRCRVILDAFSSSVTHTGAAGTGQLVKLVNNALFMANLATAASLVEVADAAGLDVPVLAGLLAGGSASSAALSMLVSPDIQDTAGHARRVLAKDLALFRDVVDSLDADLDELVRLAGHGLERLAETARRVSGADPAPRT